MGVLGKVTGDLEAPRGPDVAFQITVPAGWLGREVRLELPRNLHCAACDGGGCDACERAGAISVRERGEDAPFLSITLPEIPEGEGAVRIRIPEEGGHAENEELGRGHLLLSVKVGAEPSPCVALAFVPQGLSEEERAQLIKRSVFMAVGLIVLFLGMLKLSGWL